MLHKNFTPFPRLTTTRLLLRQLQPADHMALFALRTDPLVNRFLERTAPASPEAVNDFIGRINELVQNNEAVYWVISHEGQLIGCIGLFQFDDVNAKAEIGYELLPRFQGKGFMQEALARIIEYGFQGIGLKTIEAFTHPDNEHSTKLLEKCHFQKQVSDKGDNGIQLLLFAMNYDRS